MKKIVLTLVVLIISTALFAFDWEEAGYVAAEDEFAGSVVVTSPSGAVFTVRNEMHMTTELLSEIEKLNSQFAAFKHIETQKVTYNLAKESIKILIIPKSFTYDGKDYLQNAASGLIFYYQAGVLQYNFRIKTGAMFLRISGVFVDEEALCKKIAEALKDPKAFIERRDFDYLLNKVEQLEKEIEVLNAQNKQSLAQQKKVNEALFKNDKVLSAKIKKDGELRAQEDEKIRRALMSFHNNEWFAGDKRISKRKVKEVLTLKSKNPNMSIKEVVEAMEAKEIKISEKEVNIIFIVYYNEFKPEE